MPQAFILVSPLAQRNLSDEMYDLLSNAVREGVAVALGLLGGTEGVVTAEIPMGRMSKNANHMTILLVGSHRDEWSNKIEVIRDEIAKHVQMLNDDERFAEYFKKVGNIDSWALLPPGSWKQFFGHRD